MHSLSTGLPYPHTAPSAASPASRPLSFAEQFSNAFSRAQTVIAARARVGKKLWPLGEMRRDEARAPMQVVDAFLGPILKDALAKERRRRGMASVEAKVQGSSIGEMTAAGADGEVEEDATLLDHLVKITDGELFQIYGDLGVETDVRASADPKVLKDETLNILLAGRDTVRSFV